MQLYRANSQSLYLLSFGTAENFIIPQIRTDKAIKPLCFFKQEYKRPTMSIATTADYSNIDATSILIMKMVMREQQSSAASKNVVSMVNFQDYQTKTMYPIRTACKPSASTFTGGIGNWLKHAKFYDTHSPPPLLGGELLRKASTVQQSRQRKGIPPLAATKKRSLVKAHSMRTFRDQWSNGASRNQHVNREVFVRKLQRGTLVVQTRK
jgi:hypothetical protein